MQWAVTPLNVVARRTVANVLIVDDELDMRLLVRIVIENAHEDIEIVGEASDGADALRTWRTCPEPPDVVVLDYRMPGLSGLDVAAQLLAERPDQIIVLYSAYLDDRTRADALLLGVASCVAKGDVAQLPDIILTLTAGRGDARLAC